MIEYRPLIIATGYKLFGTSNTRQKHVADGMNATKICLMRKASSRQSIRQRRERPFLSPMWGSIRCGWLATINGSDPIATLRPGDWEQWALRSRLHWA